MKDQIEGLTYKNGQHNFEKIAKYSDQDSLAPKLTQESENSCWFGSFYTQDPYKMRHFVVCRRQVVILTHSVANNCAASLWNL